jgi:hypothetical protein
VTVEDVDAATEARFIVADEIARTTAGQAA